MDDEKLKIKRFLEQQLDWCEQQDRILQEIEIKLNEMKQIAQYALDHELTIIEINRLNDRLNDLTSQVNSLENQRHSVVH